MKDKIIASLQEARESLEVFLKNPDSVLNMERASALMAVSLQSGGKIMSCGNGGSMCDAMHFAEELTGRFREDRPAYAAQAISDPSHITCTANDYGFEKIFSRAVEAFGKPGDVLLAISTSGNSPNILNAAQTALNHGMKVVSLTGKTGGKLAEIATINITAPGKYSDRIQEIHIKIIHILIETIEHAMKKEN